MKKQTIRLSIFLMAFFLTVQISYSQVQSTVLVFSKTAGFRHASIEDGVESLRKLGKENNLVIIHTENSELFINALPKADCVVFLSTTGDILNSDEQKKFEKYIRNGGGFVGIHAAADTEYDWPWYGKLIGGYFLSHPHQQDATLIVQDHKHPATNFLGKTWVKFDEWYNYKDLNPNTHVLMTLDETSYKGGKNGDFHPISWYHDFDGGKVFYTGLGHTKKSFKNPTFLKHVMGGIQYALGN